MNKHVLLLFLLTLIHTVISSQQLYYYGAPLISSQTGFIKLDPSSGASVPISEGFAAKQSNGFTNAIIDPTGINSIMYGGFQLWNGTYIGDMLRMDMNTLKPSIFNTGVVGKEVYSMTYFDNYQQVAFLGTFVALQQNPSSKSNNVGACTVDGLSCTSLGSGIPDLATYWGMIRSVNSYLFALHVSSEGNEAMSMFDTASKGDWQQIYSCYTNFSTKFVMEVYQETLWLIGKIQTDTGQTVSVATWNLDEFSWDFLNASIPYTKSLFISTAVSPDGQNLYLLNYNGTNSTIYQWENENEVWVEIHTTSYLAQLAATNDGIIFGYFTLSKLTTDGQLQALNTDICYSGWDSVIVSADSSRLYAFCVNLWILEVFTYDLSANTVSQASNVTDFASMSVVLQNLCVYGEKIVVTGSFDQVNNLNITAAALWDSRNQKWQSLFSSVPRDCFCTTDGDMAVVLCDFMNSASLLLVDYASSDSGTEAVAANTQIFEWGDQMIPEGMQILNGEVYVSSYNYDTGNLSMIKWSETSVETIFTIYGDSYSWILYNNTFYLTGSLDENDYNMLRFDMQTNTFLSMDQLYVKTSEGTEPGIPMCATYWSYTDMVYVGGEFNFIGNLKSQHWGGVNLDGVAADSVAGGYKEWIFSMLPIENRMYLLSQPLNCDTGLRSGCGALFYFDASTQTYSNFISQGVLAITVADDSVPVAESSSSSNHWKIALVIGASVVGCLLIGLIVFVAYRRTRRHYGGHKYSEIPDIQTFASVTPIDFYHDDFVMKSVLGRGAVGTVWSCVFPNKEAGTYAVKQMLFSKGDTKKIETVKQEIDILEKFRHPNIVHYCGHRMETTSTSVEFFIFMELYEQPCSLKGVIQKKLKQAQKTGYHVWFTYEEIKWFLIQIAEGLHYLHLHGIAHRDLKCANILVRTKDGSITSLHISDFGISRVILPEDGANRLASTMLGTPSFMAPEILQNQKYDAFKADIWSFGIMMYEMITWCENEIPGKKPQLLKSVTELVNQDQRFQRVIEIFDKCTQQEPSSRPTASDLLFWCENLA